MSSRWRNTVLAGKRRPGTSTADIFVRFGIMRASRRQFGQPLPKPHLHGLPNMRKSHWPISAGKLHCRLAKYQQERTHSRILPGSGRSSSGPSTTRNPQATTGGEMKWEDINSDDATIHLRASSSETHREWFIPIAEPLLRTRESLANHYRPHPMRTTKTLPSLQT